MKRLTLDGEMVFAQIAWGFKLFGLAHQPWRVIGFNLPNWLLFVIHLTENKGGFKKYRRVIFISPFGENC